MTRLSFYGGPWDGAEFPSAVDQGGFPPHVQLKYQRTEKIGGERAIDPRLCDLTPRDFPILAHAYDRVVETPRRVAMWWRPQ